MNEFHAAAEELLTREREHLGGPPSPQEVEAYARGELSDDEAARIRSLLVFYPEAAGELMRNVPEPESLLSDEDLEHDWQSIRRRLPSAAPSNSPLAFRKTNRGWMIALAAMLSVTVFGGLLYFLVIGRGEPRLYGLRHELMPVIADRGESTIVPYPLPADESNYLLALLLFGEPPRAAYRLDIVDMQSTPRVIWSGNVASLDDKTIVLTVPRRFFKPGIPYQIELHRAGSREPAPAARYLVRVADQ